MAFDHNQHSVEYIRKNQRQFMLKVNRIHEPDMVAWLESKPAVQTYLKELIRADMEKSSSVPDPKQ